MKKLIDKIKGYFADKKKRHLVTAIAVVPFLVVIGIFGVKIIKEAKTMLGLVNASSVVAVDTSHSIKDGNFVLRENSTNVQDEYFKELKKMYESNDEATPEEFSTSTVKNFVADFFTWSNKQGQYDVGGMYYIYTPQRATVYTQTRDQFYKYINEYINEFGADSLLEVESVEASIDGTEFEYDIDADDMEFNAYKVNATWTYVSKGGNFNSSSYPTKSCFVVIDNNGRYEIVYMGDKPYDKSMDEIDEDIEEIEEENINEEESE